MNLWPACRHVKSPGYPAGVQTILFSKEALFRQLVPIPPLPCSRWTNRGRGAEAQQLYNERPAPGPRAGKEGCRILGGAPGHLEGRGPGAVGYRELGCVCMGGGGY